MEPTIRPSHSVGYLRALLFDSPELLMEAEVRFPRQVFVGQICHSSISHWSSSASELNEAVAAGVRPLVIVDRNSSMKLSSEDISRRRKVLRSQVSGEIVFPDAQNRETALRRIKENLVEINPSHILPDSALVTNERILVISSHRDNVLLSLITSLGLSSKISIDVECIDASLNKSDRDRRSYEIRTRAVDNADKYNKVVIGGILGKKLVAGTRINRAYGRNASQHISVLQALRECFCIKPQNH